MNDQLLFAYLAGIVDGEGSICVKVESKSRPHAIYLEVCNTNYAMIKLFDEQFGGKVRKRTWSKNQKNAAKNWKPCFEWSISKRKAASAIKLLFPYLRIKKRQAVLALRMAALKQKYTAGVRRRNKHLNEKLLRVYDKIKTECKRLNKRGLTPVEPEQVSSAA